MGIYSYKVLNEIYFGKQPELLEMEKQIGKIRRKFEYKKLFKNYNSCQETQDFNRMVEKFFGFKTFSLLIDPNMTSFNAYTIPITYRVDGKVAKNAVIATKKGFKYRPEDNFCTIVVIYSGILMDDRFTDGEVLAVILHEIGHNFQTAITDNGGLMDIVNKTSYVLQFPFTLIYSIFGVQGFRQLAMGSNALGNKIYTAYNKACRENKVLISAVKTVQNIGAAIDFGIHAVNMIVIYAQMLFNPIGVMFGNILGSLYQIIDNFYISDILFKPQKYKDEKVADNFAAMYGYGPEFSTGFGKMETKGPNAIDDFIQCSPIFGKLYDLVLIPSRILICLFDVHPDYPARIRNNLRMLEDDLNRTDLDPKLRKELESDVKKVKGHYQSFLKNIEIEDSHYFLKLYWSFLYQAFGGDIREVFAKKDINSEYHKAYKRGKSNLDKVKLK